jgi:hypothetical protein
MARRGALVIHFGRPSCTNFTVSARPNATQHICQRWCGSTVFAFEFGKIEAGRIDLRSEAKLNYSNPRRARRSHPEWNSGTADPQT